MRNMLNHALSQANFLQTKPSFYLMFTWSQLDFSAIAVSIAAVSLKGHGNEADFLGVLQKWVPHRSLTLPPFEPFRFWLRIRGDIRNRKTTPRLAESIRLPIDIIFFKPLNISMVIVHYIPNLFFAELFL